MKMLFLEVRGLPHCPRNRSHAIIKKGKFSILGKTEAARSYEKALKFHLEKFKSQAELFKMSFDPSKHALVAIWEFLSPDVLTKSGKVSENGVDLDAHKVLQDTIFEFIGIDDAYIVRDTRSKRQGVDFAVFLDLRLMTLEHREEVTGMELL